MGELLSKGHLIEKKIGTLRVVLLSAAAWAAYQEALAPRVRYEEIREQLHILVAQIQLGPRSVVPHETGHGVKISQCPIADGIIVDTHATGISWGAVVERLKEAVDLLRSLR